MALDYTAIRRDKEREYGTKVGNYGRLLAEDIYADRTHFIFELLQNAEDALRRRDEGADGPLSVSFRLSETGLRFSHYGKPFDEIDVRGICEFGESTKADDLTTIGRFGVGFKAVYAVTDRPEIHSGPEDFAVENYVLPTAASGISRNPDETVILLPFKSADGAECDEIAEALADLDASTLLFLRKIDEIRWEAQGDRRGTITRKSDILSDGVRRVRISGDQVVTAQWLVFSRAVPNDKGEAVGDVEIAFSLASDGSIEPINGSLLSVFFPTSVPTGLRFLMQGPYRTTLARDNIPWADDWNKQLVRETALLFQESLRWIRDNDLLNAMVLCCLPTAAHQYIEPYSTNSPFAPIFDATKEALSSEPLLPGLGGDYVSAKQARLGSTQDIRELFSRAQLAALYGEDHELIWLDGTITENSNQTQELWQYLTRALGISVTTPESIVPRLRSSQAFLEEQSDEFIVELYAFFNGQRALWPELISVPLVRLEDNSHVRPAISGQPRAFLPGTFNTGFPTVKAAVCQSELATRFLRQGLGLSEPDLVDDVIQYIIPEYRKETIHVSDDVYERHIERILRAFDTDSHSQRSRLVNSLRTTRFVRVADASIGSKSWERPGAVYFATEHFKDLFSGVDGVKLVDQSRDVLLSGDANRLLEACGTSNHLRQIACNTELTSQEKRELREKAGTIEVSHSEQIDDHTLLDLDRILSVMPKLDVEGRWKKARSLWETLHQLDDKVGSQAFSGTYKWFRHRQRAAKFDAAFIRQLNETAWVPDENGELVRPELVLFDALGWRAHPFLQSKIQFKPPIIDSLAQEAGLEPGAIDLMRKEGLTESDLRELLQLRNQAQQDGEPSADGSVAGSESSVPPPAVVHGTTFPTASGGDRSAPRAASGGGNGTTTDKGSGGGHGANSGSANRGARESGSWQFFPHVDVQADGVTGSDSSEYTDRMSIEEQAIQFILKHEPSWQRMPTGNPGYDLCQEWPDGTSTYCEVKGMSGTLNNHTADMTPTEFRAAQKHGEAYWLYVVENVGKDDIRILKIQDPVGHAHRFSFNSGWEHVADVVS